MLGNIDQYFLKQEEPVRGCLQFLRSFIPQQDVHITEAWKYGMPFFCYKEKMCCYLWIHKKLNQPYIGIVEGSAVHHPDLLQEKRARMKILLIDPTLDIPVEKIKSIIDQMLTYYRSNNKRWK